MPDLTGLPALDLAIGLSFIFLLLSLLASAVQEYIASVLAWRSKMLVRGIGNMLEGSDTATAGPPETLTTLFYDQPAIRSLYRTGRNAIGRRSKPRLPSYISPRAFGRALLGTLDPDAFKPTANGEASDHDIIGRLRAAIAREGIPEQVRKPVVQLLDEARGDVDMFRKHLEEWFDDSMARVSGWYKRKAQIVLIVLAVGLTVGLNVNTLTIGERLWNDASLRAALVQQAQGDANATKLEDVKELGVPMGWTSDGEDVRFVGTPDGLSWWFNNLGGWLLTVAAITLGAPFWFDALSRFSRLRSSGKPEQPLPASAFGKPGERV
jgi:hypothetical protein